ncbi:MAG: hypothetical protein NZ765_06555 [Anaerolineae bacterium]|nr:hypothetical protein [Anaerolineae bacterium]MDW8070409.1 hypothetical protein [Anaerolineae bacterium]
MKKEEELQWFMNLWLDGAIRSYGYIGGTRALRNFLRSAAKVVIENLRRMAKARGKQIVLDGTPQVMIAQMVEIENVFNIFPPGQLEMNTNGDGSITLVLHGCPYAEVCTDILTDLIKANYPRDSLPCIRSEVYAAALAPKDERRCRYQLTKFTPGYRCQSTLQFL